MNEGIMTGYGIHIRQLRQEDVELWKIELGDHQLEDCIAVDGIDLGDCLAAVVAFPSAQNSKPELLWSDNGEGVPIIEDTESTAAVMFARSVATLAINVHPQIIEAV